MNIAQAIDIYGGGKGSGCNPEVAEPKCGRPSQKEHMTGKRRPKSIKVSNIDEALLLIDQGKVVEFGSTNEVHTLLKRLATMANEAKAAGKEAKNYDLCNVTVKGTNLFCHKSLGIPRIRMPQFEGTPVAGSDAEKLEKNDEGKVNGAKAFQDFIKTQGIKITKGSVKAAHLRASQKQLIGSKIAKMTVSDWDISSSPIFVSRDNYVIDGHHRWAAIVGRDAEDGSLGELKVNVIRIDAPIAEVLKIANKWTKKFGIKSVGA